MHFVLVQPPVSGNSVVSVTPPLGLAYLAAILERKGVRVTCLAADAERLTIELAAERIVASDPDVVGLSTTTLSVKNAIAVIRSVKQKRPRIVALAGGPHATVFPGEMLRTGFDFVVRGEGEETIDEFVDYLNGAVSLDKIKGLSYLDHGQVVSNEKRPFLNTIDDLPFPAWRYFPLYKYHSDFKKSDLCLPVITSRGCPGQCIFCYKDLFGNRYRARSPASVVAEIEYLRTTYGIVEFAVVDDNFTTIPRRALDICNLLVSRNIGLSWSLPSGIRVDTVSAEMFDALKKAGCYRVGFGIESGNEEILKVIKKNVTKDKVRRAVTLAKKAGMETYGFFMIGNLKETAATVDDTIRFAKELNPDVAQFTVATPLPGSEMYDILRRENRLCSCDWDDYDYLRTNRIVFRHESLSAALIARKIRQAYFGFYFRPRYVLERLKKIGSPAELKNNIRALCRMLKLMGN